MRRRKYGNKKVTIDGNKFDSKAEARRYEDLKLMLKAGVIKDLELQKEFEIIPKQKGERRAVYKADFVYFDKEKNEKVIEDVKSKPTRTSTYVLKRKLVKLKYPEYVFKEVYY